MCTLDLAATRLAMENLPSAHRAGLPYNDRVQPSQILALANILVFPAWLLLIFIPGWKWTRVVAAYITPAVLSIAWTVLMSRQFAPHGGGFGSFEQLGQLARDPYILIAVWLHNLILDVFLGAWEVRDAQRLGVPHAYVIPCLIVTFLAGPVGLLAYFVVRVAVVRRFPWKS